VPVDLVVDHSVQVDFSGSADALARTVQPAFAEAFGQQLLIDNRAGANLRTDGPLIPFKEQFSGFWVVQADSVEVARELAFGGSKACNRKVELRQFYGN
jgi:hypothetical protein